MRAAFTGELEQLRLQVEVMAVLVDENLDRMERVLASGDRDLAATALAADDAIDAMLVSLTQRSYDLLGRQNPMAGDLRLVVSVLRMLESSSASATWPCGSSTPPRTKRCSRRSHPCSVRCRRWQKEHGGSSGWHSKPGPPRTSSGPASCRPAACT